MTTAVNSSDVDPLRVISDPDARVSKGRLVRRDATTGHKESVVCGRGRSAREEATRMTW